MMKMRPERPDWSTMPNILIVPPRKFQPQFRPSDDFRLQSENVQSSRQADQQAKSQRHQRQDQGG